MRIVPADSVPDRYIVKVIVLDLASKESLNKNVSGHRGLPQGAVKNGPVQQVEPGAVARHAESDADGDTCCETHTWPSEPAGERNGNAVSRKIRTYEPEVDVESPARSKSHPSGVIG